MTDSGIGIAHVDRERIFEPFSQVDASESRRYGGTGLGLAISRGSRKRLGGELGLASEPGRGSMFSLFVPLASGAARAPDARLDGELAARGGSPVRRAAGLRGRVLVAEDGADNQRLIERLLDARGARGRAGRRRPARDRPALGAEREGRPFDAVLMDMQMPELDGYAATQALRDGGYARPIIALSAHAMDDDRERCLTCGCDAFAPKPIDREQLLDLLAKHLAKP